jgi:hypothetical protein
MAPGGDEWLYVINHNGGRGTVGDHNLRFEAVYSCLLRPRPAATHRLPMRSSRACISQAAQTRRPRLTWRRR